MGTSHTFSSRKIAFGLIALAVAFVPMTAAAADDRTASSENSDAVAALKASLPSTRGFEVDNVRVTDAGVSCISYRVPNDTGGETRAQAVVEGDKVLRSTGRNSKFAKAWNSKCAGSGNDGD
jgi:hypothetical protein